jgi:hypothetical protein
MRRRGVNGFPTKLDLDRNFLDDDGNRAAAWRDYL